MDSLGRGSGGAPGAAGAVWGWRWKGSGGAGEAAGVRGAPGGGSGRGCALPGGLTGSGGIGWGSEERGWGGSGVGGALGEGFRRCGSPAGALTGSRWGRVGGRDTRELGEPRAGAEAAPLPLPPQVLVLLQRAGGRPGEADQAAHPEHEQAEPAVRAGHDPLRAHPARAPALGAHPTAAQLPGESPQCSPCQRWVGDRQPRTLCSGQGQLWGHSHTLLPALG